MLAMAIILAALILIDGYCYINGGDGSIFFGDRTHGEYFMRCRKQYGDDIDVWPDYALSKLSRLRAKAIKTEAKAAKKYNG